MRTLFAALIFATSTVLTTGASASHCTDDQVIALFDRWLAVEDHMEEYLDAIAELRKAGNVRAAGLREAVINYQRLQNERDSVFGELMGCMH